MKITLVSLIVKDPIAAFQHYTEVLGFVEHTYMPDANIAIIVSPEEPKGTAILLEPNDNPIAKTFQEAVYAQGMPIIIFGVADVQAEYEKLKGHGVIFTQEPTKTDWGIQATFDDTCGNLIQISQQ